MKRILLFILINSCILINVVEGQQVLSCGGHNESVSFVKYSHKGDLIASGSETGIIKIWSAKTGELLKTLKGHYKKINSLYFSDEI